MLKQLGITQDDFKNFAFPIQLTPDTDDGGYVGMLSLFLTYQKLLLKVIPFPNVSQKQD